MRRKRVMLWIVSLVLGFLALPAISNAAEEGIPCTPEPTDMFISYGDLVRCSIDPIGDQDTFRFTGTTGEAVNILATRWSGGNPCIWLYDPDGIYVTGVCNNATTVSFTTTLGKTGTHTILVREYNNDQLMDYALSLERLAPPSPPAQAIQFGVILTDEINPVGDQDVFYFGGNVGETINLLASRQSGGNPCIWLYRPDGTYVTGVCNNATTVSFTTTLDQTGIHTILVREYNNDQVMGYSLDLECLSPNCGIKPPDVAGCINLQGSPLADRDVVLKQYLEPDQTTKTDANGCYEFSNAVSGKKFRVIIKGPALQ